MSKTIALAEVANHSSGTDCWVAIDGLVYDITKFLDQHPGGEEVVLETAGGDATEGFEDVGHSQDAREMLKEYLIGQLPEDEKAKAKAVSTKNASEGGSSGMIAIVAIIVAVAAYFFTQQ
eukprot:m.114181 g.114181  ORF g.114181 m.114181 type:complete len:120 (-) comp28338_c1_seq1:1435-1794(-)